MGTWRRRELVCGAVQYVDVAPLGLFPADDETMKKRIITYALLMLVAASSALVSESTWAGPGHMDVNGPYGGYCQGPRWGWYGARSPVTTVDDARKHLEKFYEGKVVTVGSITDQGLFYKAEIMDRKNTIIDYVIINKRNGRIRSIL